MCMCLGIWVAASFLWALLALQMALVGGSKKYERFFFAVKPGGAAAAVGKGWLSFPYSCVSA